MSTSFQKDMDESNSCNQWTQWGLLNRAEQSSHTPWPTSTTIIVCPSSFSPLGLSHALQQLHLQCRYQWSLATYQQMHAGNDEHWGWWPSFVATNTLHHCILGDFIIYLLVNYLDRGEQNWVLILICGGRSKPMNSILDLIALHHVLLIFTPTTIMQNHLYQLELQT